MNEESRIAQFEQMTQADPDNELGHFSLGKAYLEAGRFEDAIGPFSRVLELAPRMSKAYQLLGEACYKAGRREEAVEAMTSGVTVADARGDLMPRDAMAKFLTEWGVPVPAFQAAPGPSSQENSTPTTTPGFKCSRCGRPGGKLEKQPFKGPLGQRILDDVCRDCWREWIAMGTKVINEMGLVLSTPAGQETYDQYMIEFLQFEE